MARMLPLTITKLLVRITTIQKQAKVARAMKRMRTRTRMSTTFTVRLTTLMTFFRVDLQDPVDEQDSDG